MDLGCYCGLGCFGLSEEDRPECWVGHEGGQGFDCLEKRSGYFLPRLLCDGFFRRSKCRPEVGQAIVWEGFTLSAHRQLSTIPKGIDHARNNLSDQSCISKTFYFNQGYLYIPITRIQETFLRSIEKWDRGKGINSSAQWVPEWPWLRKLRGWDSWRIHHHSFKVGIEDKLQMA